jgi:hypothetical protein
VVFLVAIVSIALVAVVAVSNLALPTWLSIVLALLAFVVPTALGLSSNWFAKQAHLRAEREDARRLKEEAALQGPV